MRRRRRRVPMTPADVDFHKMFRLQAGVSNEELRRTPGLEAELRRLWEAIGHVFLPRPTAPDGYGEVEEDCYAMPPGTRAWGFWKFDFSRDTPDTEAAQFGILKARGLLLGSWEETAAEAYLRQAAARDAWMHPERTGEEAQA